MNDIITLMARFQDGPVFGKPSWYSMGGPLKCWDMNPTRKKAQSDAQTWNRIQGHLIQSEMHYWVSQHFMLKPGSVKYHVVFRLQTQLQLYLIDPNRSAIVVIHRFRWTGVQQLSMWKPFRSWWVIQLWDKVHVISRALMRCTTYQE